ncbi:vegetative incompatibility protein HET-E-1 [Achaetomium macrosporum]|uniref:Vegetative incompatibility protein HET-E-1 n=1 Tax=Achaetomium macrosporum TaxID=79813 RepID=A0AAN7C2N3_9PEZI|nr:vegetative incompatibility protein HET-E-1 [Achaetomium macrosporum]
MRLINVSTREVEEFLGTDIPQYAILSHTWGTEEVTLHEMEAIARYRRSHDSHRQPATHMVSPSAGSPDAMKLMLLHTMLMAFRGDRSHSRHDRAPKLPALTDGYDGDEDDEDDSDDNSSHRTMVPPSSPHSFERKAGYAKIAYACSQAERDGYRYVWVDTCCIDKRSSAEVSEAINSMFSWYQRAAVCYAYLEDVHSDDYANGYLTWKDHFNSSRWFTRGWTLQELLAPRKVVFYAKGWRLLGTKSSLVKMIEKITRVDELTLLEPRLIHSASVAQRMAWAANRTTTRPEDMAYSLLGIFGVNTPIIYGEGENAFLRLQEEIIRRSDDHSIFAWGTLGQDDGTHLPHNQRHHNTDLDELDYDELTGTAGVLARSPRDFAGMEHVVNAPPSTTQATSDYSMTNKGLHIELPLIPVKQHASTSAINLSPNNHYLAILNCHPESEPTTRLALLLTETSTPNVLLRVRTRSSTMTSVSSKAQPKVIYIPTKAASSSQAQAAKLLGEEEIIVLRTPDLLAPGYEVVDIRGRQPVRWNQEFGTIRLAGINTTSVKKVEGLLYQLAVVTFWNRHLRCGFLARVLVEAASRLVWVDLVKGTGIQGDEQDDAGKRLLVYQAERLWEDPGQVEVSMPGLNGSVNPVLRRTVMVELASPPSPGAEEQARNPGTSESVGWVLRPGHELKLASSVTFTEKWEKDYQRTVNAKVKRKKKGVIELSMSSMLWQTALVAQKGEDIDQPS